MAFRSTLVGRNTRRRGTQWTWTGSRILRTNNLSCRDWLDEAWFLLDEHIVQLWTPRIKAQDDR
ncbi:hypothetical protein [Streptomyces sp. enrichment culture]|uniref:hypothetical protein n=1 Tax=Streptomyces sp. enrichment culture TaxID=1795815 RepID=UPI003F57762D